MSASSKKKIRKELEEAKLTERQAKEKKESRKLRIYSISFTVLLIGIILVTAFFGGKKIYDLNKTKWTTALKVGDHKINCVEMNYYYRYAVANFLQQSGNSVDTVLALYGVDLTQPLDQQQYYDEEGRTWANFFLDEAVELATSDYVMYDLAMEAGFKLSDDLEATIADELSQIESRALEYQYTDVDDYVAAYYGPGADYESFHEFLRRNYIATAYQEAYADGITVSEDQINEYNTEHVIEYNSYSYNTYTITVDSFLDLITDDAEATDTESSTTTEETTETEVETEVEPTAEQTAQAEADALAAAETLKKATTIEEFNAAIAALAINEGKETTPTSTESVDVLYSSLSEEYSEWISDDARQVGDVEFFKNTETETEETETDETASEETTETITGYTIIFFAGKNENNSKLDNVRHIFIELEDDEVSGETSITEDAYTNAETEAQRIYDEWTATDKTEADFIALVNKYSDDTDAEDGLYENISQYDTYYYGTFSNDARDWAIDPERKVGDCAVITGDYGCHVMYYVGESTETYRHFSISSLLRSRMGEEWYNNTISAAKSTVAVKNTKPMDFSSPLYQTDTSSDSE